MKPLSPEDDRILTELYDDLVQKQKTYVGYPNSQLLDNAWVSKFLNLTINNVGDPFEGNNGMHTCALEKEVIEIYSSALNLSDGWGYVTNGGTESNLYGLYLAREAYPDGVLYFSEHSHYSLPKAARLLGLKYVVVNSKPCGSIDLGHLARLIEGLKHYPVIINANVGTTMTGAIDPVDRMLQLTHAIGVERVYIHCDAALFGGMLPFVEGAPVFDFRLPIGSLAISGHKFLGSPIPSGVVLVRKKFKEGFERVIEYIGSKDATISGSRDGIAVLVMWAALKRLGLDGLKAQAMHCLELAAFGTLQIQNVGWGAWRNTSSNIIVFRRPSDRLIRKWALATDGRLSHLVVMPGISRNQIELFVEDLKSELRQKLDSKLIENYREVV